MDTNISYKVELFVSCKHLSDLDVLSKSDPAVWLFALQNNDEKVLLGRTETIRNNLNPEFSRTFVVDYCFEVRQPLMFYVLDIDCKKHEDRMEDHDVIGTVRTTLGEIVGARNQTVELKLTNAHSNSNRGTLVIRAERVANVSDDWLDMTVVGTNLDKKDFFGKSDPYLRFLRLREDGSWVLVHQTDYLRNTLNPHWPPLSLSVQKLCNGDLDRPVCIEVYDWDANSEHDLIGACQVNARRILEHRDLQVDVIHPEKKRTKGAKYKNSGVLSFPSASLRRIFGFLDYLRAGWQLSLAVAIDFTASNGTPSQRNSLHYRDPTGQFNEYQNAISSIGQILEPYDYDKLFPVYGFGGVVNGQTDHCFPLTFDQANPYVAGVAGIMQAYTNALAHIPLSGPTIFARIINSVAATAAQNKQQKQMVYTILLIITDGEICDMPDTIDAIVAASELPMSIIIVGVGNEGFENMRQLDADTGPLRASNGKSAVRDIVQFVPLRTHRNNPASLARETLAEVPKQLTQYMLANHIFPAVPQAPGVVPQVVAEYK